MFAASTISATSVASLVRAERHSRDAAISQATRSVVRGHNGTTAGTAPIQLPPICAWACDRRHIATPNATCPVNIQFINGTYKRASISRKFKGLSGFSQVQIRLVATVNMGVGSTRSPLLLVGLPDRSLAGSNERLRCTSPNCENPGNPLAANPSRNMDNEKPGKGAGLIASNSF
jgi:hypothetical protein